MCGIDWAQLRVYDAGATVLGVAIHGIFSLAKVTTLSHKALLMRHTACGLLSILSALTRESPSMRMLRVMTVVRIHPSALEAEIINMMIICSFAARSTDAPPRRAPVIIPGMDMIPSTLQHGAMTLINN